MSSYLSSFDVIAFSSKSTCSLVVFHGCSSHVKTSDPSSVFLTHLPFNFFPKPNKTPQQLFPCRRHKKFRVVASAVSDPQVHWDRKAFTQRSFYTQQAFTQRILYTQKLLHTHKLFHREAFEHRSFYTQTPLHTEACTHGGFYAQKLLHREAFTHRRFPTEKPIPQSSFYTLQKIAILRKLLTFGHHIVRKGCTRRWKIAIF